MSEVGTDYASAAPHYVDKGWKGILPLPPGKKVPPPKGTTGYDGYYPSGADIQEWITTHTGGNLALRLPNIVVGVDVDNYGAKTGGQTLAEAEKRWGPLPPTVRSTARNDGVSGIRLFQIDAGMEFETVLAFPEMGLGDVEIIQYFHRYCVAWPSLHPTEERLYRWLDANGMHTEIPRVGTLPRLPVRWINGLQRKVSQIVSGAVDVSAALAAMPTGPMSLAVKSVSAKAVTEVTAAGATRHDATLVNVLRLIREAEKGEPGVPAALAHLKELFVKLVTKDGSRTRDDAYAEFDRMVEGQRGHGLVADTPSVQALMGPAPKKPESLAYDQPVKPVDFTSQMNSVLHTATQTPIDASVLVDHPPFMATTAPEDNALVWELMGEKPQPVPVVVIGASVTFRTSWGEADVLGALSGIWEPATPTELARVDGALLFYPGKVNALVGEPESAKSWIAQAACAQAMEGGRNVVYIDFEDSLHSIIDRFRHLGVPDELIAQHLTYIEPDVALGPEEQEELDISLGRRKPAITVVDGVNAAMGILGLDLEKNKDATTFHQYLLSPLTRGNAAVVTIDHIPKNKMGQNGFAIGAQAKKATIDGTMIGVRALEQFGKGRLGRSELAVLKDKSGAVRALAERRGNIDYLATAELDARVMGSVRVRLVFEQKQTEDTGPSKADLGLMSRMERVCKFLEEFDPDHNGVPLRRIVEQVTGNKSGITDAINSLVLKGNLRREKRGNSNLHFLERPYRIEADDLLGLEDE